MAEEGASLDGTSIRRTGGRIRSWRTARGMAIRGREPTASTRPSQGSPWALPALRAAACGRPRLIWLLEEIETHKVGVAAGSAAVGL